MNDYHCFIRDDREVRSKDFSQVHYELKHEKIEMYSDKFLVDVRILAILRGD